MRQVDVARLLGVSRNWVSKIERRETRLDVLQFVALCRALNLDPAETLTTVTDGASHRSCTGTPS